MKTSGSDNLTKAAKQFNKVFSLLKTLNGNLFLSAKVFRPGGNETPIGLVKVTKSSGFKFSSTGASCGKFL